MNHSNVVELDEADFAQRKWVMGVTGGELDSAPVLPVADTQIVGQHVDATIISAVRDVSEQSNVEATFDRLNALHISVSGVVLTCPKSSRYYYNRH